MTIFIPVNCCHGNSYSGSTGSIFSYLLIVVCADASKNDEEREKEASLCDVIICGHVANRRERESHVVGGRRSLECVLTQIVAVLRSKLNLYTFIAFHCRTSGS